jgi:adenine phosphoribosyltransferase
MIDDDLTDLIRTVPDFPRPGILFRDITTLLAHGEGLSRAVAGLARLAETSGAPKPDAIAGIEARGFIFGAALAVHLGVGFIPLRKAGKLPVDTIGEDYALEYGHARLELDPSLLREGERVLLVDDLLATGGTAVAGARLLRRAGALVERAVFVIDLPQLGGSRALAEADIAAHALIAFDGH